MVLEKTIHPGQWKAAKLLDEISCILSELWHLPLVEVERRKYMKLTKNIIDRRYLEKDISRNAKPDRDNRMYPAGDPHERSCGGEKMERLPCGPDFSVNTGRPEESFDSQMQAADRQESSEIISLASMDLFAKGMDILRFSSDIPGKKKLAILEKIADLAELHSQMIESELQ